mmetsp:Transcript_18883/g.33090  ORF Transcript_18883/g.33090 Transcript_18883/m.33090 type:complete len:204 (-) Transcript_18883:768-1379(-)
MNICIYIILCCLWLSVLGYDFFFSSLFPSSSRLWAASRRACARASAAAAAASRPGPSRSRRRALGKRASPPGPAESSFWCRNANFSRTKATSASARATSSSASATVSRMENSSCNSSSTGASLLRRFLEPFSAQDCTVARISRRFSRKCSLTVSSNPTGGFRRVSRMANFAVAYRTSSSYSMASGSKPSVGAVPSHPPCPGSM